MQYPELFSINQKSYEALGTVTSLHQKRQQKGITPVYLQFYCQPLSNLLPLGCYSTDLIGFTQCFSDEILEAEG